MSKLLSEDRLIAHWPPKQATRSYKTNNLLIDSHNIGMFLPAYELEKKLHYVKAIHYFDSWNIYSSIPDKFLLELVLALKSKNPPKFPTMQRNKAVTVKDVLKNHELFKSENYEKLGWKTVEEYEEFLTQQTLTAFAPTAIYYNAPIVFKPTKKLDNKIIFESQDLYTGGTLPIISVAGFEFRNFNGKINITAIQQKAQEMAAQMLRAASDNKLTDLVMIPVGMGVFIKNLPTDLQNQIKNAILTGMNEAILAHPDKKLVTHFVGPEEAFEKLPAATHKYSGIDAYTLALDIKNQKDKKAGILNAGDHDWMLALDSNRKPGQCMPYHTLFDSTADEYLALMTLSSIFHWDNALKYSEKLGTLTRTDISNAIFSKITSYYDYQYWKKYLSEEQRALFFNKDLNFNLVEEQRALFFNKDSNFNLVYEARRFNKFKKYGVLGALTALSALSVAACFSPAAITIFSLGLASPVLGFLVALCAILLAGVACGAVGYKLFSKKMDIKKKKYKEELASPPNLC